MKRMMISFLILFLLLGISACSNSNDKNSDGKNDDITAEDEVMSVEQFRAFMTVNSIGFGDCVKIEVRGDSTVTTIVDRTNGDNVEVSLGYSKDNDKVNLYIFEGYLYADVTLKGLKFKDKAEMPNDWKSLTEILFMLGVDGNSILGELYEILSFSEEYAKIEYFENEDKFLLDISHPGGILEGEQIDPFGANIKILLDERIKFLSLKYQSEEYDFLLSAEEYDGKAAKPSSDDFNGMVFETIMSSSGELFGSWSGETTIVIGEDSATAYGKQFEVYSFGSAALLLGEDFALLAAAGENSLTVFKDDKYYVFYRA